MAAVLVGAPAWQGGERPGQAAQLLVLLQVLQSDPCGGEAHLQPRDRRQDGQTSHLAAANFKSQAEGLFQTLAGLMVFHVRQPRS